VPEELERDGVLVRVDAEELAEGALVAVGEAEAGDHLGDDEPGAVAARLEADEPVADAGQRGEDDAILDGSAAEGPGVGEGAVHRASTVSPGAKLRQGGSAAASAAARASPAIAAPEGAAVPEAAPAIAAAPVVAPALAIAAGGACGRGAPHGRHGPDRRVRLALAGAAVVGAAVAWGSASPVGSWWMTRPKRSRQYDS
jgi:hypothetical protein